MKKLLLSTLLLFAALLGHAQNSDLRYKVGDVNHDNMVNTADIVELVNRIVNNDTKDIRCDVNGNGTVDENDVATLAAIITGKESYPDVDILNNSLEVKMNVFALQNAADNADGANYMLTSAKNTVNNAAVNVDLDSFVTTLNISVQGLSGVSSVSILSKSGTTIAGGMTYRRTNGTTATSLSSVKVDYGQSSASDVVTVKGENISSCTAYLLPSNITSGITVTVRTADGKFYSQDFSDIKKGEENAISFTENNATYRWMSTIPGNTYFNMISIPGAHDAATKGCTINTTETQAFTIEQLLNQGVRAFDFRPSADKDNTTLDNMYIYHGIEKTKVLFKDAMHTVTTFLKNNPTETAFVIFREEDEKDRDAWRNAILQCLENEKEYIATIKSNLTLKECRGKMVVISRENVAYTDLCGKCGWGSSFGDKTVFYGRDNNGTTGWTLMYQDEYEYTNKYKTEKIAHIERLLTDYISKNETNANRIYINCTNVAWKFGTLGSSYIPTTAEAVNLSIINSEVFKNSTGRWGIMSCDYICEDRRNGIKLRDAIINQNYKYIYKGRTK